MALPPSYPWSEVQNQCIDEQGNPVRYVGHRQLTPQLVKNLDFPWIESYPNRHDAFVTAATFQTQRPESRAGELPMNRSLCAFHLLSSGSSPLHGTPTVISLPRAAKIEDLRMVHGFRDLGSFAASQRSNNTVNNSIEEDLQHIHDALDLRLHNIPSAPLHDASSQNQGDLASKLVRNSVFTDMRQEAVDPDRCHPSLLTIHVYQISVFSKSPEDLNEFDDEENVSLLYSWAKSHGVYGNLHGSWQTSLLDVIEDGALRAGHELMILVRQVSGKHLQEMQRRWQVGVQVFDL